jgi:NitT/TauT family transport system substrate-binding protein
VVATGPWIRDHPGTARKFLLSLAQASDFMEEHPAEARAMVRENLNLSETYMPAVWEQNQFSLSLDQSLVTAMEDEARWMVANNLTTETAIPDIRSSVSAGSLAEIDPGSVRIIG